MDFAILHRGGPITASWTPHFTSQSTGPAAPSLRLGQARGQDPHELRRGRRPHLRPGAGEVVLHRRVRQAEPVGGFLLRSGVEDRDHDRNLAVRGASGGAARGGHFAAMEAPDLFMDDVRSFFRTLR
jgi:hypothetical protein